MTRCMLWFRPLILLFAASSYMQAQVKPTLTVELATIGVPPDSPDENSYNTCPYQFLAYRAVEWLDAQRVLVAFSTTPRCSQTQGPRRGAMKLVTLDLQGHPLNSTTVGYDAGDGIGIPMMLHDGIWIGPEQLVLVDVPGTHLKAQPDSRNKVLVFSQDLRPLQEIDTDYHEVYGDSTNFKGVQQDRKAVLFWTSDPPGSRHRKCLLYTGAPLRQTGLCSLQELDAIDAQPPLTTSVVPKSYQQRALPGSSMDGSRSSVFMVKEENTVCELSGKLCPTSGKLVVFETPTNRLLFKKDLPLDGRAALSPDGMHMATVEKGNLEIFDLR
jgi:hypothetical protein